MSDGVKAESGVTTKRYPAAPERPGKVGGGTVAAPESQELVVTPTPGGDPATTPEGSEKVDPKAETRVLSAVIPGKKPKPNCKHCYGRGYEGTYPTTDPMTGKPGVGKLICRCMKDKPKGK